MSKPAKRSPDPFIVVFCVFIGILMGFFVVITLKIVFSPICSADAQHVCVVDVGSIVGLTSAVFGIAATLLAFLGAFAVAYWWANLDKRIEERANKLIEQSIQDQEAKFQGQIADNVKVFDAKIAQLEISLRAVSKEIVVSTALLPPWDIEEWAHRLLAVDSSSEIALQLVISYLREVDMFLPNPPAPPKRAGLYLAPSDDIHYFWDKALEWREIVKGQNNPEYLSDADRQIDQRRPGVEAYEKQKGKDN